MLDAKELNKKIKTAHPEYSAKRVYAIVNSIITKADKEKEKQEYEMIAEAYHRTVDYYISRGFSRAAAECFAIDLCL